MSAEGLPSYAPPGAISGQAVKAFNSTLYNWGTTDPVTHKIDKLSWTVPLTAVNALQGTTYFSRVWANVPGQVTQDTAITGFAYDFIPFGHAPLGVYTTPHWEFHVIYQDFPETQLIDCTDPTVPPADIVLPDYLLLPPPDNCYPGMGLHAIWLRAPEFNKEKFTKTHLFVFYQGANFKAKGLGPRLRSFEPKATNDFFRERKSFVYDGIPQSLPAGSLGRSGNIPTKLEAVFDERNDVFVMTLSGFVPAT